MVLLLLCLSGKINRLHIIFSVIGASRLPEAKECPPTCYIQVLGSSDRVLEAAVVLWWLLFYQVDFPHVVKTASRITSQYEPHKLKFLVALLKICKKEVKWI